MGKQLMILHIKASPYPGSEINAIKEEAGNIAEGLKCTVEFNFNGTDYIADDEGNVAKKQSQAEKLVQNQV